MPTLPENASSPFSVFVCHPDEGRDPSVSATLRRDRLLRSDHFIMPAAQWVPACAGMT